MYVREKAFYTEQINATMEPYIPIKCKDPGYPTIPITIGECQIGCALLDLGASVNLIPYTIFKQLGLGDLKPTRSILQMADRSVKAPRGVIEDVLVQVGQFCFPVDFMVLDTEGVPDPSKQISIILGRPFLATARAVVNCKSGVIELTFGNMEMEMNIFECVKKPMEEINDFEEIEFIDVLTEEYMDTYATKGTIDYYESIQDEPENTEDTDTINAIHDWRPQFEPFELPLNEPVPSDIKDPIPERKPLPSN